MAFLFNTAYDVSGGTNLKNVVEKCIDRNVAIKSPPEPIIKEGWCGKAKGLNQAVWEIGFIKEDVKYTQCSEIHLEYWIIKSH